MYQRSRGGRCVYLILLYCDDSLSNELFYIHFQDPLLRLDLLVHQRLGEHGLIHLIMAVTSVAHLKTKTGNNKHDRAAVMEKQ